MHRVVLVLALVGCQQEAEKVEPNVAERLGAGEVRAGVIRDESALIAGISAEGRVGDLKIYNDRVQFVLQGLRQDGDYYVAEGGAVIDADIVRPEGELGRDAIDEWQGMYGLGRMVAAESVEVVEDGSEGRAVIRVVGRETPLGLLEGVTESLNVVPDFGLRFTTDYILEPASSLLEVRTTIEATQTAVTLQPGDIILGAREVLEAWNPGVGLDSPAGGSWTGLVGKRNEVAYAVSQPEEIRSSGLDLVGEILDAAVAFGAARPVEPGGPVIWTRHYAVGRDLAEITDAIADSAGLFSEQASGVVTAADGPVAGARVNVMVDGDPYTAAFTRSDGSFSALVPAGSAFTYVVDGRGYPLFHDFPAGWTSYAPYAADSVRSSVLERFSTPGAAPALATGRGFSAPESPLTLGVPATLVVRVADGLPFAVKVSAEDPTPVEDYRVARWNPGDYAALGWSRGGEVRIQVEPGVFEVIAHRGIRHEPSVQRFTLAAGEVREWAPELPEAYSTPGYLLGDPHMHGSPSADATVPMEDRLVDSAAHGLQLHFGTDHDHVADYRPLLQALGLQDVMNSVVADEVSSVVRGHLNAYPLEYQRGKSNGGAWLWWEDIVENTTQLFDRLLAQHGDFILQSNHPMSAGLASSAGWSTGVIADPDYWDPRFDAIEVENNGGLTLEFFTDLVVRGMRITPVGVSDIHGYLERQGVSATFIGLGVDRPADYTDARLREAMRAGRTVVTRGPFLESSITPGSTVVGAQALQVTVRSPEFIQVDRLILYRDGNAVETVNGSTATFELAPEKDAVYWVIAEGDSPMAPLWPDLTPWAMISPIRVDVGDAGWIAPLPPLTLGD
jgi:hypothetical protein